MVRYYDQLGRVSPRMKVVNMGKTSEGRPFYALFIVGPIANSIEIWMDSRRNAEATAAVAKGV